MNYLVGLLFALTFALPLRAVESPDVHTKIISEAKQVMPGETFTIGVHFLIEPGWHIYWKVSGDAGFPTTIDWKVPAGIEVSELKWPKPHIFQEAGDIRTAGYKDEVVLLASVKVPANWPAKKQIDINAHVKWLVCKVSCIPGDSNISRRIGTGEKIDDAEGSALLMSYLEKVPPPEEDEKILVQLKEAATAVGFGTALLFAFLGGLILNVMPCVLPVLAIKVFRLTKQKEQARGAVVKESFAYMVGVLVSFALLGGLVIFIKSVGQEVGWGFQFQEPRFVIALTSILFLSALSFMGYFEFSLLVPAALTHHLQKGGTAGALWDGFLATVLATPCTAPLLGPALGFSFAQPPLVILFFFLVIGLGLALPYVLFAVFPPLTAFLPKPGHWMETFKELMAFPLLGTGIWLLWVLGQQKGVVAVIAALIFLMVILFALWAGRRVSGTLPKLIFVALVVLTYFFAVEPSLQGSSVSTAHKSADTWRPYSTQTLEDLLGEKKTVFVDFTADWCLTCQLNKRVLHSETVQNAFDEAGVVALRADWTNRSDEITRALRAFNRSGVPAYALYRQGDSKALLLPELLTEKVVLDALKK